MYFCWLLLGGLWDYSEVLRTLTNIWQPFVNVFWLLLIFLLSVLFMLVVGGLFAFEGIETGTIFWLAPLWFLVLRFAFVKVLGEDFRVSSIK